MEMVITQTPDQAAETRAELVAILEELRDLLCKIHEGEIPARYVAFDELAGRVQDGIDRVEEL